jgi:hypothetical protein
MEPATVGFLRRKTQPLANLANAHRASCNIGFELRMRTRSFIRGDAFTRASCALRPSPDALFAATITRTLMESSASPSSFSPCSVLKLLGCPW